MRQLVASFILALSAGAFAAEPDAVIASAGPLIDALEAFTLIAEVAVSPAYIPGYGLQLNAAVRSRIRRQSTQLIPCRTS